MTASAEPTPSPDPAEPPRAAGPNDVSNAEAAAFLSRVQGAGELTAALLALLLPHGSEPALQAWQAETAATAGAAEVLAQVRRLLPQARLPWFERLLKRMRRHPLEQRQILLESTRRVMSARRTLRPIDRLHWFSMRQRLGEATPAKVRQAASSGLSQLPDVEVHAIAVYTAFLSRLIPFELGDAASDVQRAAGPDWYLAVMKEWPHHELPALQLPSGDALVHALQQLQALAWMQRPVLVRTWLDAALARRERGRLRDEAADALRLSCALLDSPLPPELARHYIEPPEELR
jgi:hypothetical protein